jgi:hypothetical protein
MLCTTFNDLISRNIHTRSAFALSQNPSSRAPTQWLHALHNLQQELDSSKGKELLQRIQTGQGCAARGAALQLICALASNKSLNVLD